MARRLLVQRIPDFARQVAADVTAAIDSAVTYKKVFISTQQTGTGSAQNIVHGFSSAPAKVAVVLTGGHNGAGAAGTQAGSVTEGTHTSADCVVTVTSGCTYKVIAWR